MQFEFPEWNLLSLNDPCKVTRTKLTGQCKFIEDCPLVEKEILKQGLFPQLCGFFNSTKEIICCPEKSETENTEARISQKSNYCLDFIVDLFIVFCFN